MNITVYCGSNPGKDPAVLQAARDLGALIGARGDSLVYGGARVGLMGAVADAALAAGAEVTGVQPQYFEAYDVAHHGLTHFITTTDMAERKRVMYTMGQVYIALPGGIGTLEELSEILSLSKLDRISGSFVLLNIHGYYDKLIAFFDQMVDWGYLDPVSRRLIQVAHTVEEAAALIEEKRASLS
jgi:uncharacterized protein (TIGR00730 family)